MASDGSDAYVLRDTIEGGGGTMMVPVAHTPPEAMRKQHVRRGSDKFLATRHLDSWGLGITFAELMTGLTPYLDEGSIRKTQDGHVATSLPGNEFIHEFVKSGGRLELPSICPAVLRVATEALWSHHPRMRPSADQIVLFMSQSCQFFGAADWDVETDFAKWAVTEGGLGDVPEDAYSRMDMEILLDDGERADAILECFEGGRNNKLFRELGREAAGLKAFLTAEKDGEFIASISAACERAKAEAESAEVQERLRLRLLELTADHGAGDGKAEERPARLSQLRRSDEEKGDTAASVAAAVPAAPATLDSTAADEDDEWTVHRDRSSGRYFRLHVSSGVSEWIVARKSEPGAVQL
eukprot:g5017.t1